MPEVAERVLNTFTKRKIPVPDALRLLKDGEEAGENFGVFKVLSKESGDERVVWDRRNLPDINAARNLFNDLIAEGMVPYCVGTGGKRTSDVMREFDPHAGQVIFVPQPAIVGG